MWEVELFYFAVKGSRVTAPEEGTGGEEPEGSKRPIWEKNFNIFSVKTCTLDEKNEVSDMTSVDCRRGGDPLRCHHLQK